MTKGEFIQWINDNVRDDADIEITYDYKSVLTGGGVFEVVWV